MFNKIRSKIIIALIVSFDILYSQEVSEYIKVNQVGYLPEAPKIFFVSTSNCGEFSIKEVSSNKEVFRSTISYVGYDNSSGDEVWIGDFSSLTDEGNYYIFISSLGKSYNFKISKNVYYDVYYKTMRGFLLQRCGISLSEPEFTHNACHLDDGKLFLSGKNKIVDAVGGWHDAGDYGKYIVNLGVSVGTLFDIYFLNKTKFKDNQLSLPYGESFNNIPDILDEIKYGIKWIFAMQDETTGGVYHKLTAKNFEPMNILPNEDYSERYIIDLSLNVSSSTPTSAATGNFVGMLAQAYRAFKNYDPEFAQKCLSAAEKAWEFLENNPTIVPPGGFRNPQGVSTGEYGDSNDTDERLWAAAELFSATSKQKYNDYFKTNYYKINSPTSWGNLRNLAVYTYYFAENADPELKQTIKNDIISYADSLLQRINSNPYKVVLRNTEYYWGSNSVLLNYAIDLVFAYEITKDEKYKLAALEQLHYILGRNPTSYCYVTGLGSKSPKNIHHRPSVAISKALPGFLVGGPNSRGNDNTMREYIQTYSPPPAKCYLDDTSAYSVNEVAINWNAPLVFLAAYFIPEDYEVSFSTPIFLSIDSPKNNSVIRGQQEIKFTVYSSTKVKEINIYVSDNLETSLIQPQTYVLDTKKYSDGEYELRIVVKDILNRSVEQKINVRIANNMFSQIKKHIVVSLNNDNVNQIIDFTDNSRIQVKKVVIYDIKGKTCIELKSAPFQLMKENFKNFPTGVYIYKIITSDNKNLVGTLTCVR
jgi:endoglucanase